MAVAPDPYQGLDGLQAAWNRFTRWLRVDLPRQWDEIAELLGLLGAAPPGGSLPPPGAPPAPLPPPEPLPADRFTLANLPDDASRRLAESRIGLWPAYLATGRGVSIPLADLDGSVNVNAVVVATLGLDVWIVDGQARAYLPGNGPSGEPGALLWHPGDVYQAANLTIGGGEPPEAHTIAALPLQVERDQAQAIVEEWPGIYATGQLLTMPQTALDGSVNVYSAAIQALGWEVVIWGDRPYAYPPGEGRTAFPGGVVWHPGDRWVP